MRDDPISNNKINTIYKYTSLSLSLSLSLILLIINGLVVSTFSAYHWQSSRVGSSFFRKTEINRVEKHCSKSSMALQKSLDEHEIFFLNDQDNLTSMLDRAIRMYSAFSNGYNGKKESVYVEEITTLIEDISFSLERTKAKRMKEKDSKAIKMFDEAILHSVNNKNIDQDLLIELAEEMLSNFNPVEFFPENNVENYLSSLNDRLQQLEILMDGSQICFPEETNFDQSAVILPVTKEDIIFAEIETPPDSNFNGNKDVAKTQNVKEEITDLSENASKDAHSFEQKPVEIKEQILPSENKGGFSIENTVSAILAIGAITGALVSKVPLIAAGAAVVPVISSAVSKLEGIISEKAPDKKAKGNDNNCDPTE